MGVFRADEAFEPAADEGGEDGSDNGCDEGEAGEEGEEVEEVGAYEEGEAYESAYAGEMTLSMLCKKPTQAMFFQKQLTLLDLCAPSRWPPPGAGFVYRVGAEIERDEDRCHEFKASLPSRPHDLEKYINAFANCKGGKLLVGVADDGSVRGVRFGRAHRDELIG